MNRWSRWARQMRSRHGRREQRGTGGEMILARMGGVANQFLVTAPRMAVTLQVRAHATLGAAAPAAHTIRQHSRGTLVNTTRTVKSLTLVREIQNPPEVYRDSSRFVETFRVTPGRATFERHVSQLHELVRQWSQKSSVAAQAAQLPASLRLRAVRSESLTSEPARVLPVAGQRRAESFAANEPAAAMGASKFNSPGTLHQTPAPAAINLEAITSHVLQQMDRRLVAYRERMGRT